MTIILRLTILAMQVHQFQLLSTYTAMSSTMFYKYNAVENKLEKREKKDFLNVLMTCVENSYCKSVTVMLAFTIATRVQVHFLILLVLNIIF